MAKKRETHPLDAPSRGLLGMLIEKHPDIFNLKQPKPLAIGINDQLGDMYNVSVELRSYFLRWWCKRYQYFKALRDGDLRYNLDGTTTPLEESHKAGAKTITQRIKARNKARKKAEKAKKRERTSQELMDAAETIATRLSQSADAEAQTIELAKMQDKDPVLHALVTERLKTV